MTPWRFVFVPNPLEWSFGHVALRWPPPHNSDWLLDAWCFGPFEWQRRSQ